MSNAIPLAGSPGTLSLPDANTLSSYQKIQLDLKSLDKALQSGDVAAAKTAFVNLQKDAPNLAAQSQDRQSTNPRAQAMALLGRALQGGDMSLAKKSLSALQEIMKGANQGDASSSSPEQPLTLAAYLNDPNNPSTQNSSLLDVLNSPATDNSPTQNSSLFDYSANGSTSNSSNGTPTPGSFLNTLA